MIRSCILVVRQTPEMPPVTQPFLHYDISYGMEVWLLTLRVQDNWPDLHHGMVVDRYSCIGGVDLPRYVVKIENGRQLVLMPLRGSIFEDVDVAQFGLYGRYSTTALREIFGIQPNQELMVSWMAFVDSD